MAVEHIEVLEIRPNESRVRTQSFHQHFLMLRVVLRAPYVAESSACENFRNNSNAENRPCLLRNCIDKIWRRRNRKIFSPFGAREALFGCTNEWPCDNPADIIRFNQNFP